MTRLLIPTKPEINFGLEPTNPTRSSFGPGYLLDCEGDPPGAAWLARIEVEPAERIVERGGFGKNEAEMLLGRPLTTWRART